VKSTTEEAGRGQEEWAKRFINGLLSHEGPPVSPGRVGARNDPATARAQDRTRLGAAGVLQAFRRRRLGRAPAQFAPRGDDPAARIHQQDVSTVADEIGEETGSELVATDEAVKRGRRPPARVVQRNRCERQRCHRARVHDADRCRLDPPELRAELGCSHHVAELRLERVLGSEPLAHAGQPRPGAHGRQDLPLGVENEEPHEARGSRQRLGQTFDRNGAAFPSS
jgi:hypothetical protein